VPRIGQRMTRGAVVGVGLGLVVGLGFYMMARGVNVLAGTVVFSETGMMLFGFGIMLLSAIGIELSADMAEGSTPATGS